MTHRYRGSATVLFLGHRRGSGDEIHDGSVAVTYLRMHTVKAIVCCVIASERVRPRPSCQLSIQTKGDR
jgi:hypothetical protein